VGRGGEKKNTHFFSFGREKKRATLNNNAKPYHCKISLKLIARGLLLKPNKNLNLKKPTSLNNAKPIYCKISLKFVSCKGIIIIKAQ
jgi:hypothetical protein